MERLNPDEIYKVELDICSVDDCRYKYHENEWVVAGKAEPLVPSTSYVHPDTPSKGSEIMKQPLSFRKVKITNNNDQKEGFVSLYSFCLLERFILLTILCLIRLTLYSIVMLISNISLIM